MTRETRRGWRVRFHTPAIVVGAALLLSTSPLFAIPVAAAEPTGQEAQWLFDEASGSVAADATGNGHTGTVSGATFVAGKSGHALSFQNPGDRVVVPDSTALESGQFTITMWVKASASPGTDKVLVAKGASGCGDYSYAVTTGPNGGLAAEVWGGTSEPAHSNDIAPGDIWDGQWHFVAVVNFTDSVLVWIDAIVKSTNSGFWPSRAFSLSDDTFTIGGPPASCASGADFNGVIDDVRYYPSALSDVSGFVPPVSTTTTIDALPATTTLCSAPEVRAVVSPAPKAGGTVTFSVDHGSGPMNFATIGPDSVTGEAIAPVGYATLGTNTYRAKFEYGRQFQDSTSPPVSVTLTKCPSTTLAWAYANPVPFGTASNLRATISPPDDGAVDFYEVTPSGDVLLAAGQVLDYTSTAYFNTVLAPGDHTIRADFPGGLRNLPSSGQFVMTVSQTSTTSNAWAAPEPSVEGRPLTLSFYLSEVPDGGTVTFTDITAGGSTVLGSAPASTSNSTTDVLIGALPVGIRTIRADYSGTVTFAAASVTFDHTTLDDTVISASGVGVAATKFYPYKDSYLDSVAIRGSRAEPLAVAIKVYSPTGKVVRSATIPRGGGAYSYPWNGRTSSGSMLASGKYKIVQTLTDAYGNHQAFTSYTTISAKRLYFSTKTIVKTGKAYTSKFVNLPSGAGYGYTFTMPSATMYKTITIKIQGKTDVPPARFGAQDFTRCSVTATWVSSCFDFFGYFPPSVAWVSHSATNAKYHHGHTFHAGVIAGAGSKASIYKVEIVVKYGILR
jgi:Concanavalin A-like lectin/glucanases superfamily/FlgD Ig-like domain